MAGPGRPSLYSDELATRICERLAAGESLLSICRDDDMPQEPTVRRWARDDVHGFYANYARSREIGYAHMFDEIQQIADTPEEGVVIKDGPNGTETRTGDMIEHRRLKVDTRKWMLAKALPKVYGDRLALEHGGTDDFLAALNAAGERARSVSGT